MKHLPGFLLHAPLYQASEFFFYVLVCIVFSQINVHIEPMNVILFGSKFPLSILKLPEGHNGLGYVLSQIKLVFYKREI